MRVDQGRQAGDGQGVSDARVDRCAVSSNGRKSAAFSWSVRGRVAEDNVQMLSGCDYLDSIPGVGLKTAHRLLRRHKTVEKVVQMLRLEGTLNVPPNYIKAFAQAELAFLHQRVFDPKSKRLVPLNGFPVGGLSEEDEKWVGLDMEEETAQGVAKGDLHPETRLPMVDMCPDYQPQPRGNGLKVSSHLWPAGLARADDVGCRRSGSSGQRQGRRADGRLYLQ